ncbi:hypothetical protein Tco_0771402 [Tanacetum coccineum]|uniref:Uncharacterized protein n=1 Tax=Tanacetum coccineum TaxID=301880 RepID=A0ABQ4ZGV7_9ASTR
MWLSLPAKPRWQSQAFLLAIKTWRGSKGYDDGFRNQGTRLKTEDAPKDLEASPPHYKYIEDFTQKGG